MERITNEHPLSKSKDLVQENIEKLKELFPTIVKEGEIDFSELEVLFGKEIIKDEEYYQFTWAGKSQAKIEANKLSTGTLRPCKEDSKNWDTTQNIFIEGDNLEVLKLMQKSYAGKIKMMYFDPPYNTGNEFVYNDDYSDNLKNYLHKTNQTSELGKLFKVNSENEGRYHSKWLNMMYPRLLIAHKLLHSSGVLFISADDNEFYNLKKLLDEIFGEINFVISIAVNRASEIASNNTVSMHEYILVYCKNYNHFKVNGIQKYTISRGTVGNADQTMPIIEFPKNLKCVNIPDGIYKSTRKIIGSSENIENYDPIIVKDGRLASPIRLKAKWRSSNDMRNFFDNNCKPTAAKISGIIEEIYFEGDRFIPQIKKLTFEKIRSLINTNRRGSNDIAALSLNGVFDFPKSVELLKHLISLISLKKDDYILDIFAGSATTAHSVLQLNSEDLISRKFIMVQLQEPTKEGSGAWNAGFKTIADIGKERIRRAGDKILNEKKSELEALKKSIEGKMLQEETEEKIKQLEEIIERLDIGFKVFKLDSSNILAWDGSADKLEENLLSAVENIKPDRKEEDVLYEILIKYGIDLSQPVEEKTIAGCKVFSVGLGVLFVCLSDKINTEVADGIGNWKNELQPEVSRVVFKDSGFAGDVEKTNTIQILKRYGITDVKSI